MVIKVPRIKPNGDEEKGAALVTRARITRLIRDVIYERADTRRPSPAAAVEKPPFLAIRHVSRLNQGNYGAKLSKRPLPLARSHISRRDASDIDRVSLKTSDGAAREEILRARVATDRFHKRGIN